MPYRFTIVPRSLGASANGLAALILLGVGLVVHLVAALSGSIDLDEYQFIANGWDVYRGLRPYVDFWDNHGPAANYVFAIPFYFWPAVHEIIVLFRILTYGLTVLTAIATACVARVAFPQYRYSGRIAAALLLAAPMYVEKSHEVRGDNLVTVLWATGLALCLYGLRHRRNVAYFLAGLAWGLTLWFTPKGVFVSGAGFLVICSEAMVRRKCMWPSLLTCCAGIVATTTLIVGWLDAAQLWNSFFRLVIVESVSRSHSLSLRPFLGACKEHPFWMGSALIGVASGLNAVLRKRPQARGILWLWAPVLLFLIYYFFLLPTRNRQSLLPLHPVVAVLCVGVLSSLLNRELSHLRKVWERRQHLWAFVLLIIGCHSIWHARHSDDVRGHLKKQIVEINRLAIRVPPDEYVLSGEGPPLFRPFPLPAHVLVNYLREQYAKGKASFDIPEALMEKRVRFVSVDPRLRTLPRRDLEFFRKNYLPVAATSFGKRRVLLAAGKVVQATDQPTTVAIQVPRRYWIAQQPGNGHVKVLVNGTLTTCCVHLAAGEHSFQTVENVTTVVLSSVAPNRLDWKAIENGVPLALQDK
ncbi:MAG: hypothetical protein N2Z21_00385 [Candidatus Sumerlaeaceae bacterium]|nr:hypothetical protein [Candidatus Sumerlaeaceae bacterium]